MKGKGRLPLRFDFNSGVFCKERIGWEYDRRRSTRIWRVFSIFSRLSMFTVAANERHVIAPQLHSLVLMASYVVLTSAAAASCWWWCDRRRQVRILVALDSASQFSVVSIWKMCARVKNDYFGTSKQAICTQTTPLLLRANHEFFGSLDSGLLMTFLCIFTEFFL